MITHFKDEPTTIQWLDETCEAIVEALKAAGVESLHVERLPGFTKPEECGQSNFWKRERPGQEYKRTVLWVVTGEHVQIVGSATSGNDVLLPSVTVGVLNYAAPMKDGWARFQEYKHTASAGKRGIRIATVTERFLGYHELIIDPSKANSTKKAKTAGVRENDPQGNHADLEMSEPAATSPLSATPADKPQPRQAVTEPARVNKSAATSVEQPPQLEMAPAPAGKFYVHIPMMVVSQPFALALEALVRGANGEINMTSNQQ